MEKVDRRKDHAVASGVNPSSSLAYHVYVCGSFGSTLTRIPLSSLRYSVPREYLPDPLEHGDQSWLHARHSSAPGKREVYRKEMLDDVPWEARLLR